MPRTQPLPPIGNIQSLNGQQANGILRPIYTQAGFNHTIDPQWVQTVNNAIHHFDDSTAELAFSIIKHLPDKQPFAVGLIQHASYHARLTHASWAFEAMSGALDFGPFYQVIEDGVRSPDVGIARAALTPILRDVQAHKFVDPLLVPALTLAMEHGDDGVANYAVTIAALSSNLQPFFAAFQKCANNPNLPKAASLAAYQLGRNNFSSSSHATSFASQALSPNVAVKTGACISNVRLDFKIHANGSGPDADSGDVLSVLAGVFDKSLSAGFAAAKAKVFYAPMGNPDEGTIIDVRFPADDKDHILHWSGIGIAPEFDLQKEGNGGYVVTLKERPSF